MAMLVITRGCIYIYTYTPPVSAAIGDGLVYLWIDHKQIARTWVFPGWEWFTQDDPRCHGGGIISRTNYDDCNNQKGPWRRVASKILLLTWRRSKKNMLYEIKVVKNNQHSLLLSNEFQNYIIHPTNVIIIPLK